MEVAMSYTVPDSAYGGRPSAIAAAAVALYVQAAVVLAAGGVEIGVFSQHSVAVGPYGFDGRPDLVAAIATMAGLTLVFAVALGVVGRRVWNGSGPARTAGAILHGLLLVAAIRLAAGLMAGSPSTWSDAVVLCLAAVAAITAVAGTALLAQPAAATFGRASGPLA
jgi:hypothetical protein